MRHRKAECKIYGKKPDYPFYRVAWYVTGQRRVKQFATYSKAKDFADALVKDLAKGSQSTALAPTQATDALAAVERLKAFYQQTGRSVSLLRAVSEYVDAARVLNGHTLAEAVEGFMANVVTVKRKDLAEAVEEFIQADEPRTKSANGQRAQHPCRGNGKREETNQATNSFPSFAAPKLPLECADLRKRAQMRRGNENRVPLW